MTSAFSLVLGLLVAGWTGHAIGSDGEFNCGSPTEISYAASGNLLSPCYPASYRDPSCRSGVSSAQTCSVRLGKLKFDSWIGIFETTSRFVMRQGDFIKIGETTKIVADQQPSDKGLLATYYIDGPPGYAYLDFMQSSPSVDSSLTYNFKFRYIIASALSDSTGGRSTRIRASSSQLVQPEEYIVSHRNFNFMENYVSSTNVSRTLTGFNTTSRLNLTFNFFNLYFQKDRFRILGSRCPDFLRIEGVEGYKNNAITFCGYDTPPPTLTIYPVGQEITVRFVAGGQGQSAGFLVKYVVDEFTKCPPVIPNASIVQSSQNMGSVTCQSGYKAQGAARATQEVTCENGITDWSSFIPCSEISCSLPSLMAESKLNYTLSTFGRLRPSSTITYRCPEGHVLSPSTETAVCQEDGNWNVAVPTCQRKATTSSPSNDDTSTGTTYIGTGIGCVVALIVVIIGV